MNDTLSRINNINVYKSSLGGEFIIDSSFSNIIKYYPFVEQDICTTIEITESTDLDYNYGNNMTADKINNDIFTVIIMKGNKIYDVLNFETQPDMAMVSACLYNKFPNIKWSRDSNILVNNGIEYKCKFMKAPFYCNE